ncbi:MAG: CHAT domain-containing protein [Caldilinea sp. CFX5]|nr:CHAT domain-containing protein [Caldilinea sp. CFX5]
MVGMKPRPFVPPETLHNGEVYLAPVTNWQLAAWAIARSTRPQLPDAAANRNDLLSRFNYSFTRRTFAAVLWYTPQATLSDEIYDFLHRLPQLKRIVVLGEGAEQTLPRLDQDNLNAILEERSGDRTSLIMAQIPQHLPVSDMRGQQIYTWTRPRFWLDLLQQVPDNQDPFPFPRVAVVVPENPYQVAAAIPLVAQVGGLLFYLNPTLEDYRTFLDELVEAIFTSDVADEIWLVGAAAVLGKELEAKIDAMKQRLMDDQQSHNAKHITQPPLVRTIAGADHFAVSERASICLLTYRYLDYLVQTTLTSGRDKFFGFLKRKEMKRLTDYCNRVLALAGELQEQAEKLQAQAKEPQAQNFSALADLHDLYWRMSDLEQREFVRAFQLEFSAEPLVSKNIAVIADYAVADRVPHQLFDAAAFAARRRASLLILQPLPAETNHYIGSLIDKIDNRLNKLNDLKSALHQARQKLYQSDPADPMATRLPDRGEETTVGLDVEQAAARWQEQKGEIEAIHKQIPKEQYDLYYHVHKTGEVLYESLAPLAMRKTLRQLRPRFLAVFIHDPSLPIELIRETEDLDPAVDGESNEVQLDPELSHFWSLRYAIGHMSGVNPYETNLTSNMAVFTPPAPIKTDKLSVLLCANPTRDLLFSEQEANKIADFFLRTRAAAPDVQAPDRQAQPRLKDDNIRQLNLGDQRPAHRPTLESFLQELRKGHDIVHFSGHAFFDNVLPGRSGLVLSDGALTAADVRFKVEFPNEHRPLIYANACLAGRIKSVASRFTGLAAAFIRAGAAGYISPLWSIDDQDAAALAIVYYNKLLSGEHSIGECLYAAKRAHAGSGSITWASYVLYGDPTMYVIAAPIETSDEVKSAQVTR